MILTPATPADAPRLARMHDANFEDRWDADFFREMLSQSGACGLIATGITGGDDGFILTRAVAGEAEILTIAVMKGARRMGLGGALVKKAAEQAHLDGAEVMFLEVSVNNMAARELYETLGFTQAGIRKRYYHSRKNGMEDALVLRIQLPFQG